MQMDMALKQAQVEAIKGQASESQARASKYMGEVDLAPQELMLKYSDMDRDGEVDNGFEKKLKLAQMLMQEDQWKVEKEERQQNMQNKAGEQDMLQQMLQPQQPQPPQMPPMTEEPQLQ